MKRLLAFVLTACIPLLAQSHNPLFLQADSLYAKGVESYGHEDYSVAIACFVGCDSLNKSSKRTVPFCSSNARNWVGHSYYRAGNSAQAQQIDSMNYHLEPVDQRQTVESDSLAHIAGQFAEKEDWANALKYAQQCAALEKQILGGHHYYYANSLNFIGLLNYHTQDYDSALTNWETALQIYLSADKSHVVTFTIFDQLIGLWGNLGRHDKAIEWSVLKLNTQEEVLGKNNPDYAVSLHSQANYYDEIGDYANAIELETQALEIRKMAFGEQHPAIATSLGNLANYYSSLGDYAKAIDLGIQAFDIQKKVFSEQHAAVATSLNNLAYNYDKLGDYTKAIELASQALEIRKKVFGEQDAAVATSLNNLGGYYSELGDYTKAIELESQALEIKKKVLGEQHPDYATSLNNLAYSYSELGDYTKAIELESQALEIRKKVLGEQHPDYATSLNNLGGYYSQLGDYAKAIQFGERALDIRKKALGEQHPDYAGSLSNLAGCYYDLGDYAKAIEFGEQALDIREKVFGGQHPDYATSLGNLAGYYSELGDYVKAIEFVSRALEIRKKVLGEQHPDYAGSLSNLATYYYALGDYARAIQFGEQALDIKKEALGAQHPDYALSLGNLANYYSALGDYARAIQFGEQALDIKKEALGEQHPDYATVLSNLANYYSALGDYDKAIESALQALNIKKQALGEQHPNYATSLNNLADYYYTFGYYANAIKFVRRALNIRKMTLGAQHPDYALSLGNLANYYSALGDYAKAIKLGMRALEIRKEALGEQHPDYAPALRHLAFYNRRIGNINQAADYQPRLLQLYTNQATQKFADLTSQGRAMFWNTLQDWFHTTTMYSLILPNSSVIHANTYNVQLITKGILLSSDIEFDKMIQKSGDANLLRKFETLRTTRLQLEAYNKKPITERPSDEIKRLEAQADVLEKELLKGLKEYGDFTRRLSVKWQDVAAALGGQEIAVEIAAAKTDSLKGYIALVIRKEWESPKCVYIGAEKDFEPYLKQGSELYNSQTLSDKIWKPIIDAAQIKESDTLYFAPDGIFYQLGIEYLPAGDGPIMAEKYNIRRLSSTKELCFPEEEFQEISATLYGGLRYELNGAQLLAESGKYKKAAETRGDDMIAHLFSTSGPDSLTRGTINYLPGSLAEVKGISTTLDKKGVQHTDYIAEAGTEESFKALSEQAPHLIHIATHGFYLQPTEAEIMSQQRQASFLERFGDSRNVNVIDYSMSRTGLIFAGAQAAWAGQPIPEGVDDGILTAKEISQLDLRNVDLAVLSACQTGLGEITSDGVAGLQRGFKKAGVKTLVMSLWKVDDKATQLMMTRFYENLISGQKKHIAFKNGLNYLRNYEDWIEYEVDDLTSEKSFDSRADQYVQRKKTIREKQHIYNDPKYWAAFIMLD